MEYEVKSMDEIYAELLRLALQDDEAMGMWQACGVPVFVFDRLTADRQRNWGIKIEIDARPELAAALKRAEAELQKRWTMAVPFLGSSAK